MSEHDYPRRPALSSLIANAPEIPTLHVLSSVLDAAQAAIRSVWGEDEGGDLRGTPPYEQEAEIARAVLDQISALARAVNRYREAMLWRVPETHARRDPPAGVLDDEISLDDMPF